MVGELSVCVCVCRGRAEVGHADRLIKSGTASGVSRGCRNNEIVCGGAISFVVLASITPFLPYSPI